MSANAHAPGHDRAHRRRAGALAALLLGCVALANRCASAYGAATAFALGDGASVQTPNIFAPTSTPAFAIRDLSWFVLGICAVIFLVVAGLLTYSVIRFRRRPGEGREPPQVYGSNQIELAWTVVPVLIMVVLFLATARYIFGLEGFAPAPNALQVTVVGSQWWWEIRYPDLGIVTANELHVPVSDPADPTPTFLTLESADVIHSFWVPQLVQHLLLLMVAPPLIWLGIPLLPMLQGLPKHLVHIWVGPLFAWPPLTRTFRWLVRPPVVWTVFVGSTWAWHTPTLYERALASECWHYAQHACFLATALAFWWPVVQPWPSRPAVPPRVIVLYLILADLQNTVLSAWLVFAERLIYPSYEAVPRLWGISALDDQAAAGAIMWVPGSVTFLLPAVWIVGQLLSPKRPQIVVLGHQPVVDSSLKLGCSQNGEEW
jgi:heme/copper-type cytochrome/quinol oxidase subunit 2